MRKADIARRLARRSGMSRVEAADQLDRVVNGILAQLRRGAAASLPGLGTFLPGRELRFEFDAKAARRPDGRRA